MFIYKSSNKNYFNLNRVHVCACAKHFQISSVFLYMRKLTQHEIDDLILISVEPNRLGYPLHSVRLPKVLYGRAPRIVKGKKWFDEKRPINKTVCCENCYSSGILNTQRLERHETYALFKNPNHEYIITLAEIIVLCHNCHEAVHTGNAIYRGGIPKMLPEASCYFDPAWEKAKYLLIDDELYEFSEIERCL